MNEQNDIIINSKYYIGLSYKDHFLQTGLKTRPQDSYFLKKLSLSEVCHSYLLAYPKTP